MTGTDDLPAVLDGVRAALDDAVRHVHAIACAVGTAPAGTEAVALHRASRAVEQRLAGLLVAAGDPAALRLAGATWVGRIGGPVSDLVGLASDAVLSTDDHWTGAAADDYRATLPAQQAALRAIVATCQEVDAVLDDLAAAITSFWIAIGAACLGLVVALAGALGTAATAVGAPAATAIALAGVGALVAAGDEALSSLTAITATAAARGAALHRRLADGTAFPLGAWPRSTVDVPGPGAWQPR